MSVEVDRVTRKFGTFTALDSISLSVDEGELVCVVGASGSGKSTLLRIVAGLDMPTSGEVRANGIKVEGPGSDRGMVFQTYTLYPWMNVAANVGFGLKLKGYPLATREERIAYYLDVVGLSKFATALPKQLSGGMKQRVAIARALANQPQILLMDEPFGALDVQTKEIMQEFLLDVWRRTGTTILMITHDVEEAVFLSQRIYVLTSSPGTVKAEKKIVLPENRTYSVKQMPSFQQQKEEIFDLLREEQRKAMQGIAG